MKIWLPLMYADAETRVLPGDDYNPPMTIRVTEDLKLEATDDPYSFKLIMPEGRSWAILRSDMLSDRYLAMLGMERK